MFFFSIQLFFPTACPGDIQWSQPIPVAEARALLSALFRKFVSSQNPYVKILIPQVLGSGAFGKWLGHQGGALRDEINDLMKGTPEISFTPPIIYEPGKSLKPEHNYAAALMLDFLASWTRRNKLVFL